MPWHNTITQEVSEQRPERIRLASGLTLTSEAITDSALTESGWHWQEPEAPVNLLEQYQSMG